MAIDVVQLNPRADFFRSLLAQLPGANLQKADLRGASFDHAQLQGADLVFAQLQVANLSFAQLQGTDLVGAQLQGANISSAQLQGTVFGTLRWYTGLDGASLSNSYVWRTHPPSNANGVLVNALELGPKYTGLDCPPPNGECDWSETSYAALKSLIQNSVPLGRQRDQALVQITRLD